MKKLSDSNLIPLPTRRILTMVLLASLIACGGSSDAEKKAAMNNADVFLIALRDGLWKTAYLRLDPSLREECGGSAHDLALQAIARFETRLTDWRLRVQAAYGTNIHLTGQVERQGKEPVTVGIVTESDGELWRITIFDVDGLDLCLPPSNNGPEAAEANTDNLKENE